MNNKISAVLELIKTEYSDIDTILVFGSAITPSWTPQSDIDIFLIDDVLNDSRSEATARGINIKFQENNFATIKNDMEKERGNLLHRNLSTMIATSVVISTKSPEKITELIDYARGILASPPDYGEEDLKMWHYSITDYLAKAEKDIARNDLVAFYINANYVLQNALELSLATHNTYMSQPKNLTKLLSEKDPALLQIWQEYIVATTPENKLNALKKLSP